MKLDEGRILEATLQELRELYIGDEYYKLMSFDQFVDRCVQGGTTIVK